MFTFSSFNSNLSASLGDIFTGSGCPDVILVSDEKVGFMAHKFVLSAWSPVLKELILNNLHSHRLIYLRGIKQLELRAILQCFYHGEAIIAKNQMKMFLENARDLKIKQLEDIFVTRKADVIEKDTHESNGNEANTIGSNNIKEDASAKYTIVDTTGHTPENLDDQTKHSSKKDEPNYHKHKCDKCKAGFRWKKNLLQHARIEHDSILYSCNQCKYQTLHQDYLKIHQSKHERPKYCYYFDCYFQALSQYIMKAHQESKHEGVMHFCDKCDYQTGKSHNLKCHKQSKHKYQQKSVIFSCDQCDYQTAKSSALKYHQQSKHESVMYSCEQFDYWTMIPNTLKGHYKSKHEGNKFSCDHCDFQAPVWSYVKFHIESAHEGIKYLCTQCEYYTVAKSSLKNHTKTVHDGFRLPCDQCDYKGTSKNAVHIHKQAIHEGVKHPCSLCSKKFSTNNGLFRHQKKHL